ncbi:MAG: hypothetical protein JXA78_12285 [Anaerolineales bacterium]|nr:hypothetical protein [Anaerolineales bacterium]
MFKKLSLALFVVMLILACGLFSEATQAPADETPPATQPPAAPVSPAQGSCGDGVCNGSENAQTCPQDCAAGAAPGGKCGDGLCDEAERDDPNLCPQDCTGAETPGAAPGTAATSQPPAASGAPDYEPPINVFLVLHIDPVMDQKQEKVLVTPEIYQRTYDQIDWLKAEAERHGMRFTALYNGWYPQEALELGNLDQFRALLASGHELGTHAHRLTYDPEQDLWISRDSELSKVPPITYDPDVAEQTWADAYQYVDTVLKEIGATGQNRTVCAVAFKPSDEPRLMERFGFSVAAGQRGEGIIEDIGHIMWNPWRIASSDTPGHQYAEDLSAKFVTVPHLAQIGIRGGVHGMDLSQAQIRRRFLMLYTEWLSRERRGAEDKVWSFGFVYHPEDGDHFNQELADFLDWLDENFIGKTSPHGDVIARYATAGEIADEFLAWEAAHPGVSSFNYVKGDPYPYTYPTLPEKLTDAAYEGPLDLGQGITGFHFTRDERPVYMLWSEAGERTFDFSSVVAGQVLVTYGTGETATLDAAALPLSEEPLFVEPSG